MGVSPLTCQHEHCASREQDDTDQRNDTLEQHFKLLRVQFAPEVIDKGVNLTQAKHPECSHVFRGLDGLQKQKEREIIHLFVNSCYSNYSYLVTDVQLLTWNPTKEICMERTVPRQ